MTHIRTWTKFPQDKVILAYNKRGYTSSLFGHEMNIYLYNIQADSEDSDESVRVIRLARIVNVGRCIKVRLRYFLNCSFLLVNVKRNC